jgi:predicted Rossmann-fold nucleotide-binding protein
MPVAPVICYGSEWWTALDRFIKTYLLEHEHSISPGDENIYSITEDVEVIKAIINHHRDTTSAFTPDQSDSPSGPARHS